MAGSTQPTPATLVDSDRRRDEEDTRAQKALELLIKAIMEVPLPGAPPHGQQHGAEIGLAFVDGALRQNHVRRISESLQLIDHGAALQTVRVDLSLSLLNDGQYRAGKAYSSLRGMNNGTHTLTRPEAEDALVWVPVTRLSRRSISPVEVLDAHGSQVPRLTQDETSQLMAPAMFRLLKSILDSDPEATNDQTDLYRFLHWNDRSRWVIQRALIALTTERANPSPRRPEPVADSSFAEREDDPRLLAVKVLRQRGSMLKEYFQLLDIVINHYLVVVGLSDAEDEHTLTYRSPIEAKDKDKGWQQRVRDRLRLLGSASNAYDVEYESWLSTGVRSYHFAAETELDLSIHPPFLTTNFDSHRADRLSTDMQFLATELEAPCTRPGDDKIIELELGTALGRLAELVRRRRWEADQIDIEVAATTAPICRQLRDLAVVPSRGGERQLIDRDTVSPTDLKQAAAEIADFDLGSDLSAEKDPMSSHAHAYWRKPLESITSSLTTINVRCNFRIIDGADSGPRYVGLFVGAVALLNLLIAVALFGRLSPFGPEWDSEPLSRDGMSQNADALVGVLLLVPGFLYTRLRLPAPGTIAGRLRTFTRVLAYVVIMCSALIGVLVAAGDSPHTLENAMWSSIAIDLFCFALLLRFDRRKGSPVPAPTWAHRHAQLQRGPRPVDARFSGVGSPHDP
jgi:hypothetical protein